MTRFVNSFLYATTMACLSRHSRGRRPIWVISWGQRTLFTRLMAGAEALRTELDNVKGTQPIVLQVERNGSLMFLVMEGN